MIVWIIPLSAFPVDPGRFTVSIKKHTPLAVVAAAALCVFSTNSSVMGGDTAVGDHLSIRNHYKHFITDNVITFCVFMHRDWLHFFALPFHTVPWRRLGPDDVDGWVVLHHVLRLPPNSSPVVIAVDGFLLSRLSLVVISRAQV